VKRGTYVITHTFQSTGTRVNPSHNCESLKVDLVARLMAVSTLTTTFVLRTPAYEHELPPDSTDYRSLGLTIRSLEPHNHPQLVSNQFTASSTPEDPHSLPHSKLHVHVHVEPRHKPLTPCPGKVTQVIVAAQKPPMHGLTLPLYHTNRSQNNTPCPGKVTRARVIPEVSTCSTYST